MKREFTQEELDLINQGYGISIAPARRSGRPTDYVVYEIRGCTFQIKEELKKLGADWNSMCWVTNCKKIETILERFPKAYFETDKEDQLYPLSVDTKPKEEKRDIKKTFRKLAE